MLLKKEIAFESRKKFFQAYSSYFINVNIGNVDLKTNNVVAQKSLKENFYISFQTAFFRLLLIPNKMNT